MNLCRSILIFLLVAISSIDYVAMQDALVAKHSEIVKFNDGNILALAWSSDGTRLAFSEGLSDDIVGVWDLDSQMQTHVFSGETFAVNSLSWNPKGVYLAASGNRVILWDTLKNISSPLMEYPANYSGGAGIVDWSPDGRYLSFSYRPEFFDEAIPDWLQDIHILDVLTGKIKVLGPKLNLALGFADWSPTRDVLAVSEDDTSIKFIKSDGILLKSIDGFSNLAEFKWSPDGTLFATAIIPELSSAYLIRIWSYQELEVLYETHIFRENILSISWHPTQSVLAIGTDQGLIEIWDFVADRYEQLDVPLNGEVIGIKINDIAWHPAGHILASADDFGRILSWDFSSGLPFLPKT
jgi:WD40 repeat protein